MSVNTSALAAAPTSTPGAASDPPATVTANDKSSADAVTPGIGSLNRVPANDPGAARIGSAGSKEGSFTLASLPLPPARVGGWLRALESPPLGRPAAPGAVPTVRSPTQLIPLLPRGERNPLGPNQVSNPLLRIFSPGSRMRAAEGLPQMTGSLNQDRLLHVVNRAFTPERLEQFDRMQPAQKEVARGLLSAAISEVEQPLGQALSAMQNFDEVVGLILERSSQWQELPQPATGTTALPSPATGANRLPDPANSASLPNPATAPALPNPATAPALPEGAIATLQATTRHGPLTTEVYRSASMPESKIRANIDLLQQRNPLLYAGLSTEELVRTARNSDFFLVTTQHGTSNLWGHDAPSSTTPQRAITAITERNFTAGEHGLHRGGRYAELTFVANSTELSGGAGQVVRQTEDWARSRGVDGITFYNTDTTDGEALGFYRHMGFTLTREVRVDVRTLDARVQQQLVDAGRFTRAQIDRGEAELPRYYFEKRFDDSATPASPRP